jgi:putative DNA primase/helicase
MDLDHLEAALDHARRAWRVIALHSIREGRCTCGRAVCDSPGKHPRLAAWPSQATTDERTIRSWFAHWRALNLGIVTGADSDLVGLDVDGDTGAESLRDLERQHGALPETVVSLTGRGGRHFLFRHPGGTVSNGVGLWPGIDVRGDGGYLVVPPSRTVSPYDWQIGSEPGAVPLATLPEWLLDHLRRRDHRDGGDRLRAYGTPLVLREGERNHRLHQLASLLRRYGLGERAILGCLEVINREHATPPLDPEEVARIAASAARYAPAPEAFLASTAFRHGRRCDDAFEAAVSAGLGGQP